MGKPKGSLMTAVSCAREGEAKAKERKRAKARKVIHNKEKRPVFLVFRKTIDPGMGTLSFLL
jgi:hypothetical protein